MPLRVLVAQTVVWIDHRDNLVILPSEINNPKISALSQAPSQEVAGERTLQRRGTLVPVPVHA